MINPVFNYLSENKGILDKKTSFFGPRRIGFPPYTHFSEEIDFKNFKIKPKYKKYGIVGDKKYNYIFHIRNRELRKQDNWPLDNWKRLFELLAENGKKVACIGTTKQSGYIEGTEDLRDIDLKQLFTLKNVILKLSL